MFKFLRFTANCLCVGALLLLPSMSGAKTAFKAGEEYTLYYRSASSQANTVNCMPAYAAVYKYFLSGSLTGESTVYKNRTVSAQELIEEFDAEVLFTETACGVVNYYCYTSALGEGLSLGGYSVNLHVAESDAQTAVGTPVIFGGF